MHISGCRRRLETAVTPAAGHVEPRHRQLADDRAAVHRHVHDAAPRAHQAQPSETREQRKARAYHVLDHRQIAALRVRVVEIEIASHDQFTLVGLADVEMHGARRDDRVEHRFHRLGDHRLQHMRFDRQLDAGHCGDLTGMPGHGDPDL